MADKSKIAWCDATIGPAYGCSPVSPACDHCYAARMAGRLGKLTEGTHQDGKWTGRINFFPERMEQSLRWRKPRRIFVGFMTDLFHAAVPDAFLNKILGYMAVASWHTFILLTKRPERMREYFSNPVREKKAWTAYWEVLCRDAGPGIIWPLPNVILMTTIEDQPRADERMPHLMELAGMGWKTGVSVEPMMGAVGLTPWDRCDQCGKLRNTFDPYKVLEKPWTSEQCHEHYNPYGGCDGYYREHVLSWIIAGCESGPNARPMDVAWAQSLKDQCISSDVPFFYKQAMNGGKIVHTPELDGQTWTQFPNLSQK